MKRIINMMAAGMVISLAACSASHEADNLLASPEPVVICASAPPGTWKEDDKVAVRMDGEVKMYQVCLGDGIRLKAAPSGTPFMWRASNETRRVSGWARGDGVAMETIPSEWTVAADQNSGDGAGMRQSDFLYASPVRLTYTDRFHARINFYHQTSKVMVRVKNEGALKDNAAALESLTIGDENYPVAMRASFEEDPDSDFGVWTLSRSSGDKGYIIPYETVPETGPYLKCYEALVLPDNFDKKPLLAITLLGHTYYYIPKDRMGRLTPGHISVYDISVSADTTKLEVTPMVGDNLVWTWDSDGIVDLDDIKDAEFSILGWLWDHSSSTEVTSGVIPLAFGAGGWNKEGEGDVIMEEGNPDTEAEAGGWKKDGDDQDAGHEDQPEEISGDSSGWTKEGESEEITSTTE